MYPNDIPYQSTRADERSAEAGRLALRIQQARLYVIVTETQCGHGLESTVRGALEGGAAVIQLREKTLGDRALLRRARDVRRWTARAGALFVMNDRADLAVLCAADGVHVGQEELAVSDVRRIVGPNMLIGVSTHSLRQVREAVAAGASYIGVGPVFPSRTKQFERYAGLQVVREVFAEAGRNSVAESETPAFAIGGIDRGNLLEVIDAGAGRVAVSSAVCQADDPAAAARQLVEMLHQGGGE